MHRKFRQNTNEALKALVIGQSSMDDQQQYYTKSSSNYGGRPFKQSQRDNHLRKSSFTGLDNEEDYYDQDESSSSAAISELFHGFLAIGTLGSDQMMTDPATPTFPISVDNITEKETEVTENELKLINDELEKVLGAEAPDDGFNNDSSGRNSHVSNGRSSHGSIITLSGKTEDGNGTTVCPLQGYLFGSAIELSETTTTAAAKKEHRTSLGELFQKTATHNKTNKVPKNEHRKKTSHVGTGNCGGQILPDEDITLCPQRALFLKQKIRRYRSQSNPPQFTYSSMDSMANREQWIKTDADCKTPLS
uniref:Uncharacterized protein n=1 Tax=Cannabis sativa TaxID=3483 RepID=A0A803PI37_CANSA